MDFSAFELSKGKEFLTEAFRVFHDTPDCCKGTALTALQVKSKHLGTLFRVSTVVSENIWCFVSYDMFSQDTLLYSAAEPTQSSSVMQRKYSCVPLAEKLWRWMGKRQSGFMWKKMKEPCQGSDDLCYLCLQILLAYISAMVAKGCII